MPAVSYPALVADWVETNRSQLERCGDVTVSFRPSDTDNMAVHLLVAVPDADTELLVWESGHAEFNQGTFEAPYLEHVELECQDELNQLLGRFLESAESLARHLR